MANISPKTKHLQNTQWKPGESGNLQGKPKGTKHLSTWIRDILEDESFKYKLSARKSTQGAPIEAILQALLIKAIEGDLRAFDLLGKYGYGTKIEVSNTEPPVPILGGLSCQNKVEQ